MAMSSEQKKRIMSGRGRKDSTKRSMEVTSSSARQVSRQGNDNGVTAPMPPKPPADRQPSISPNRAGSGSPAKGAGVVDEKTFALEGYDLLMKNFGFYMLSGIVLWLLNMVMPNGVVGTTVVTLAVMAVIATLVINAVKALRLRAEAKTMMSKLNNQDMLRYFVYLKRYAGFSGWYIILINVLPALALTLALLAQVFGFESVAIGVVAFFDMIMGDLLFYLTMVFQFLYCVAIIYGTIAVFRAKARRDELRFMA